MPEVSASLVEPTLLACCWRARCEDVELSVAILSTSTGRTELLGSLLYVASPCGVRSDIGLLGLRLLWLVVMLLRVLLIRASAFELSIALGWRHHRLSPASPKTLNRVFVDSRPMLHLLAPVVAAPKLLVRVLATLLVAATVAVVFDALHLRLGVDLVAAR